MPFDAHIHLFHGMDTGPKNIDETGRMLSIMHSRGITGAVAVAHLNLDAVFLPAYLSDFKARSKELHALSAKMKNRIHFYYAFEMDYLHDHFFRENDMHPFVIPKTKFVMVDVPIGEFGNERMRDFAYLIQKQKLIPLICNIERHILFNEQNAADRLTGISNAYSLVSGSSLLYPAINRYLMQGYRSGKKFLICSNAHNDSSRSPMYLPDELNITNTFATIPYRILKEENDKFFSALPR